MKIWVKILILFTIGLVIGIFTPHVQIISAIANFIQDALVKFLIFLAKPLLFVMTVVAFSNLKDSGHSGKIFFPFAIFAFGFSFFALLQSLGWAFVFKQSLGIKLFQVSMPQITEFPNIISKLLEIVPSTLNDIFSGNPYLFLPTFIIASFIGITFYYAVKRGQILLNLIKSLEEILEHISHYSIEIFALFTFFIGYNFAKSFYQTQNFLYVLKPMIVMLFALIIQAFLLPTLAVYIITKTNPASFFRAILGAQLSGLATGNLVANYVPMLFHSEKNLGIQKQYSVPLTSLGVIFIMDGAIIFSVISFIFLIQTYQLPFTFFEIFIIIIFVFLGIFIKDGMDNPNLPLLMLIITKAEAIPAESIAMIFGALFLVSRLSVFISSTSILTINYIVAHKYFNAARIDDFKNHV